MWSLWAFQNPWFSKRIIRDLFEQYLDLEILAHKELSLNKYFQYILINETRLFDFESRIPNSLVLIDLYFSFQLIV